MFIKIESSGCCERKGMVQIRFCMYLEPGDYGYEKHHVQVPVIPEGGYPGKKNNFNQPRDFKDYNKWIDSLPKTWQNNPFHNHFILVEPETTDKEIMDIAEAFLHESYVKWTCDLDFASKEHQPRNDALPFKKPLIVDRVRIKACEARVQSVKVITMERKI